MAQLDEQVRDYLRDYAVEVTQPGELAAAVDQVDASIAAAVPEFQTDSELRRDLDASTSAHVRLFLDWITGDSDEVRPPPAAHALARTLARRGLPLRLLIKLYLAGHQAAREFVTQSLASREIPVELETPTLLRLWERTSQWLNISLEILTDTFAEERERGLRGALARRAETVQAILRGEPVDDDALPGYPLRGNHFALVLWAKDTPADGDAVGRLEAVVNALGATRALTVPSGARGLWAWVSAVDSLRPVDGVRVAVGEPGRDVAGFRRSHAEALAAQRIAEQSAGADPITRYTDVEVAYLVGADPAAARALVARELHGLLGDDQATRQLRETLRAYLAADRSPEAAARMLHVHKNTVRYRINRIEQLLGHSIARRRLPLELALAHLATNNC